MTKNVFFINAPQKPVHQCGSSDEQQLCPCKVFSTITTFTRLLGRLPLTWKHNGKCIYEVSAVWLIYSLVLTVVLMVGSYYAMPQIKLDTKNLPEFLSNLTNLFSLVYLAIGFMHFMKVRSWVSLIECLGSFGKDFSCEKARRTINDFQKVTFKMLCGFVFLQGLLIFSLRLPLHVVFFKSLQLLPQFFYVLCITCKELQDTDNLLLKVVILGARYATTMFICFESVVTNYVGYKSPHPCREIQLFVNNQYQFAGFTLARTSCDQKHHFKPDFLRDYNRAQLVDYLRRCHEKMCGAILLLEKSCSP